MAENQEFARLVSLACHDLRTPLATVFGFARTLSRSDELGEPAARYIGMIEAASQQMGSLLDDLGLVARIESGRYEPVALSRDTLELARSAAERAGERVDAAGEGVEVEVDADPVERSLAALALAAQRHGAVERVGIRVDGRGFRVSPVSAAAAPIVLAHELKDLGAAVALRVLAALEIAVALEDETLSVDLPG
ncbi:MAG TPA: histidine kinase dimerization/phospho-acceptor domain-containing protein [Gaiellaceae bacterium]|jgi:signal transduction histidine kinase|nr:histidine kinase dimerization/phospho-acceptor domain-containing protein [Gaiellaceae bacterium]